MRRLFTCLLALVLALALPAAAQAAQKAKQIKLATYAAVGSPMERAIKELKQAIAEKTNGRYELSYYLAYSYGSPDTMYQSVKLGTLEIALDTTSNLSVYVPELAALDMPYLMPTDEDIDAVLEGAPGKKALSLMGQKGLQPICFFNGGWRVLINTKGWKSIDDLKGGKVRSTSSKTHIAALNSLGLAATPMPGAEMYTAIQQGVVDGADPEFNSYRTNRYVDVAKHCFNAMYTPVLCIAYMSNNWWKSLKPADKAIFEELFAQFQRNCNQYTKEQVAKDKIIAVEKEGVIITELAAEDRAKAVKLGESAYAVLTPPQAALAKEIREFVAKRNKK